VDEILRCDHLNESYWTVLSCGALYYVVQRNSNFWVCGFLRCEHSNGGYWVKPSCGAVYYATPECFNLWVFEWILNWSAGVQTTE